MVWFIVDDGMKDAEWVMALPKALRNACVGVWARCGAWSAQQLTDGFIPDEIASGIASPKEIWTLVSVGRWTQVSEGFQMADWDHGNRTKNQVLADRSKGAERAKRSRNGERSPVRSGEASGERAPHVLAWLGTGKALPTLQAVPDCDPDDVPAYLEKLREARR